MEGQRNAECGSIEYMLSVLSIQDATKFMDEMPGGFFIYRADGGEELLYANKAILRIFKCATFPEFQELTGNSFRGIVHPKDLEHVEKSIREQIAHSQYDLDYVEYRIICKDGSIRWVEDYGHFIESPSLGGIFYVFAADATEKKQHQNFIQQEHLRRLEVIEGLSVNYESILYADLDTNKILPYRLSSRTERQFDRKFQEREYKWYASDYVSMWVHPDDRPEVSQAMEPAYIQQKLSTDRTFYINYRVIKDGELQYIQLRIVNVGDSSHISRIVFGYRRVDAELQHEIEQNEALEDALNRARLANIAKNTFLSNMSHDMRTPLNAILGFAYLAENHADNQERVREYLSQITIAGEQLLSLINDVLEISHIEAGNENVEEAEFNLHKLMYEVQDALLPDARRKNLSFSLDISGLKHCDVFSDRDKLKKILLCLGSNAVKYTSDGGHVRITASEIKEPTDDYAVCEFSVEDDGIGISEDFMGHLFNAFEREKNTTMSGIHGTGLGLTIARNLTEIMGGKLSVQSALQKGSVFTLTLGLRLKNYPNSPHNARQELAVKLLNGRKILLVEDNPINLEIEVVLLQELGFLVDTAENGSIALEKLTTSRSDEYALVLMDLQMPVMDGHEAARAIRSMDNSALAHIPIIALSANAFEEDRKKSRESGMNAHLAKPVNVPMLLELIIKIMQAAQSS